MKSIGVSELSKSFETVTKNEFGKRVKEATVAVDNVTFDVSSGEIVGFIGPNGAGKSTTIKILTGILHPTSGSAEVVSFTPWKNRVKMGYEIATMFGQKSSLLPHLPVMDSYKLLGAIYDIPKKVLEDRINEIIEFFGINDLMQKKVNSLSLGQRMICEIAATTLHRPKVIFFDEPTIGLDIVIKRKVREMILMLNKKYGTTIFITSHDISDIEKLCSRIILINHGKVMLDKPLDEIKSTLLSKKTLSVCFDSNIDTVTTRSIIDELNLKYEIKEFCIELEFDSSEVILGNVLSRLSDIGNIIDLSVNSNSLENVIYDIYTNKEEPK